MKLLKKQDGFTLIEVLVAINLSFILLTLVVSVYLFTVKFTSSAVKKFDKRVEVSTLLSRIHRRLQRADSFYLVKSDTLFYLVTNTNDTIGFGKKYIRDYRLDETLDIDSYKIKLANSDNSEIVISPEGISSDSYTDMTNKLFTSADIQKLNLTILKDSTQYGTEYLSQAFGIAKFSNLNKETGL